MSLAELGATNQMLKDEHQALQVRWREGEVGKEEIVIQRQGEEEIR